MKRVTDLIPWRETNISLRPFKGFYSFNPSIHFDGTTWRVVMRNCDYHAKDGLYNVTNGRIITRNAMVVLNPTTWEAISLSEMHELDPLSRFPASHYGYEDMRLFRVGSKLVGIGTTAQLRSEAQQEIVLCWFDENWDIVRVEPQRGPWSKISQKNWVPFDGATIPTFVYSIDRGITVRPCDGAEDYVPDISLSAPQERYSSQALTGSRGGTETKLIGRRPEVASSASAPVAQNVGRGFDWVTGGLRGGTQLVKVGSQWLGMAHDMRLHAQRKNYWHRWYTVNDAGQKLSESEDFKITDLGIEFAAGLAIDGNRVVVSYGTEDRDSWIGETTLSAVMEVLKPCKP